MRSSQHRSTSAQIASAFVSPEAIAPQIDAQNGTHGSHPVAAHAAPHAPPAPAAINPLTASSQIEHTELASSSTSAFALAAVGHSPTSLCAQFERLESETHLSSADGGEHADSIEPTSWHALSISHQ